ncbi:cytochrome c [Pseudolabrys taiwanensis]|uniref:Cytochrome c n=1 Tax=Pseudolabrys taiwanensis TaxID=331696 RepID=A0A345ZWQ0_9HYPH|nr:cytochrome c [Pseudolabrys taiwanensis]
MRVPPAARKSPPQPSPIRGEGAGSGQWRVIALATTTLVLLGLGSSTHAAEVRDLIKECAFCHGDAGVAKDKDVPHLAGQQRDYLYNQLQAFHSGKRPHKEMRYMSRHMTEQEMRAIADYYASLPPR